MTAPAYTVDLPGLRILLYGEEIHAEAPGRFEREGLRIFIESLELPRQEERELLRQIPPSEDEIRFRAQRPA